MPLSVCQSFLFICFSFFLQDLFCLFSSFNLFFYLFFVLPPDSFKKILYGKRNASKTLMFSLFLVSILSLIV